MLKRSGTIQTAPHGIAALTVVMILFFVLAMAAAYTNRTLIVEQRSTTNALHSAQAIDATEAATEWAIAQINGGRVTSTCSSSTVATDASVRTRYIELKDDFSYINPDKTPKATATPMACVSNHGSWECSCPALRSKPSLTPTSDGNGQAFWVAFDTKRGPGILSVLAQGCSNLGTDSTANCATAADLTGSIATVDAVKVSSTYVGLVRALPFAPTATLTAGTTVTVLAGKTLWVANPDANTGLTIHSGGAVSAGTLKLAVAAGTPGDGKLESDGVLAARAAAGGRQFESIFGMDASNYKRQPATVMVDCAAGCTSADLADALSRHPGQVLWIAGDLNLNSDATLGSPSQPMVMVSTGTVTLSKVIKFNGFLYANSVVWAAGADASVFRGALVSASSFVADVNATLIYDAAMIRIINGSYGSFVRAPGGTAYY